MDIYCINVEIIVQLIIIKLIIKIIGINQGNGHLRFNILSFLYIEKTVTKISYFFYYSFSFPTLLQMTGVQIFLFPFLIVLP